MVMWQPAVSVLSAVWCENCPLLSALFRKGQVLRTGSCSGERASWDCNDSGDLFNQMVHRHQRFYVLFALTSAYPQLIPPVFTGYLFSLPNWARVRSGVIELIFRC